MSNKKQTSKKRKTLTNEQKVDRNKAVKEFYKRRKKLGFRLMWVHGSVRSLVEKALDENLGGKNE